MTSPSSHAAFRHLARIALAGLSLGTCGWAVAEEHVDFDMVTRIRQEGFHNSKVMETMSELTDRLGPRLTGSPQLKQANEWTRDQLKNWGLQNAHLESWGPFARGWSWELCTVRMLSPAVAQIIAVPSAWSPPTSGVIHGKVKKVKLANDEDLTKQKGKLAGVIVLREPVPELRPPGEPAAAPAAGAPRASGERDDTTFARYDEKRLESVFHYQIPSGRPPVDPQERRRRRAFQKRLTQFLEEEKALALIEQGRGEDGTVFTPGRIPPKKGDAVGIPTVIISSEYYGRITRLIERKLEVEVELEVRAKFHDDDFMAYNTIAEIPGSDKKNEVVMAGAHLDSWHTGTGATDNGAGTAAVMEAVRILQSLGVKPRRTIRVGLWSGEEQGLLGSRAYVGEHFGERTGPLSDPADEFSRRRGPLKLKREQALVSGYFNLDNGSGKIRGVYMQENAAVQPIFTAWIEPFRDLGVSTLTMRNTGGTDHQSFDAVGIPGFQFIQDPLDYRSRTHHSNMDVYERIQREDLMQASVVIASFLYHAAMRDRLLPRKPLPKDEPPEAPQDRERPPVADTGPVPAGPGAGSGQD